MTEIAYKEPVADPAGALRNLLDERPVLWVGAGASVAAGYPSADQLVAAMRKKSEDPIPEGLAFTQVADLYVASRGRGALDQLLQELLGRPHPLTEFHKAIARLAAAGCFRAIATTNYDGLIELALHEVGVDHLVQPLDSNEDVGGVALRVHKLHGSQDDWKRIILSGKSYAEFYERYAFLRGQMNALLRQNSVVFAGCSMTDPRIFDWLVEIPSDWADFLKPWRPMMRRDAWDDAVKASMDTGKDPLARGNIRPLLLERHEDLPALLKAAADALVPVKTGLEDLALEVTVSPAGWELRFPSCTPWTAAEPVIDPALQERLKELESASSRALPTERDGGWLPDAARKAAEFQKLAEVIGAQLTEKLLSQPARELLARAIRTAQGLGQPPLLRIRVQADAVGPDGELRAEAALALPWELLWLEGRHPVREGTLDVAREAVVKDMTGLDAPSRPLSVVATVAAPEGLTSLGQEEECFRLWKALGEQERCITITDTGTLEDTARAVDRMRPVVFHFTGHGGPGHLVFEDELADPCRVSVDELLRALRGETQRPLPRLAFLAACYGARILDPTLVSSQGAPSTAARLHAAGFPQVVAYFGPVGDEQSTRIDALFYEALAKGRPARAAVRKARLEASKPLRDSGGACTHAYPLGWAQLALYHRGADVPTATAVTSAGAMSSSLEARPRRVVELRGGVPHLEQGFIGRRRPRAEIICHWRQGSRAMVVHGLGGLGKTALCTEALPVLARAQARPDGEPASVVVLNGQAVEREADPLAALWGQLRAYRQDEEWSQVLRRAQTRGDGQQALDASSFVMAFSWLMEKTGSVLVYLDNAETLQEAAVGTWKNRGVAALWNSLLELAQPDGRFGLLASTRYVPEDTPDNAQLSLEQMKPMDVLRLLRWFETLGELPASDAQWLIGQLDGLPRTVEYLDELVRLQVKRLAGPARSKYSGQNWRGDVLEPTLPKAKEKVSAGLLLPRLWEALPPEVREHLGRCSALTSPLPWEAVTELGDAETAIQLVRAGLLSRSPMPGATEPGWAPHAMVLDHVRTEWNGDVKDAHHLLGRWCAGKVKGGGRVYLFEQAVRHLCEAGEANAAWPLAHGLVLLYRAAGRYREGLQWSQLVREAGATGAQLGMALAFEGELGRLAGAPLQEARAKLEKAEGLVTGEDLSFILHSLAGVLRAQGDLPGAKKLLERSNEILKTVLGTEEHPGVAASLHELARVVSAQGDLPGARKLLERSNEILKKVLGTEEHPDVAASLHQLAIVVYAQGHLSEARTLLERSIEINKRVLGTEEHPSVAASLHQLAIVVYAQGHLSEARTLLERSIEINKRVLRTEEHPDVAASLHELAGVLRDQGDLPGARKLLERSIDIKKRVLGTEEHPEMAVSLHSLAGVLRDQGDLPGARKLLERSNEILKRVLGTEEHLSVAASLHELARVASAQGDLPGARKLLERSINIKKRVLGTEEHPDVAASLQVLAVVLSVQGDLPGARKLLERGIEIDKRVLGTEEHPSVATSLHSLAGVLRAQGDLPGARKLLERSIEIKKRVLGTEEHPSVAASLHELARVASAQGDLPGARKLLERVLEIEASCYGTREHYSTAQTEVSLGTLLLQTGEPKKGREFLLHAHAVFIEKLGHAHPHTAELTEFLSRLGISAR